MAVAGNKSTSEATFECLSVDPQREVRWCVARNPWTPPSILARLLDDKIIGVRLDAIQNPSTPSGAIARRGERERLTKGEERAIRTWMKRQLTL